VNEELGGRPRVPSTGAFSTVNRLDGADPDAVWLITGASDGFGRSVATEALHCGRRVVATSIRRENLEMLAPELRSQLMPIELDVNDESSDREVIDQAFETFGRIDVVVNNAGFEDWHCDLAQGDVLARVQTNLFGSLWISHYATSFMKSAGRGQVVQVFALDENDHLRTPALFERVRNALERFCESLAREIAPFGLQVVIGQAGECQMNLLLGAPACGGATCSRTTRTMGFLDASRERSLPKWVRFNEERAR
jgi:NAD(P)-dependent dehydrogenase (short-subunit alcohol dehydrogenase family)